MSLTVPIPPLVERFRVRLEAALTDAEAVIEGGPERVLAAALTAEQSEQLRDAIQGRAERFRASLEAALADAEATGGIAKRRLLAAAIQGYFERLGSGASPEPPDLQEALKASWPAEVPRVLTVGAAIALIREKLEALAQDAAAEVEGVAALVLPEETRAAVLARDEIVNRWHLPTNGVAGDCLRILRDSLWNRRVMDPNCSTTAWASRWDLLARPNSLGASTPPPVPPELALNEVVEWARAALEKLDSDAGRGALARLEAAMEAPNQTPEPIYSLGVLRLAWRAVEQDRRRPVLAIDAGKVNHGLLMGWTEAVTERRLKCRDAGEGFVELLFPGQNQIVLGLPGEAHERLISELQHLRDSRGLRTYATLLHLLSIRGQRQGFVRWTIEEHLGVQGVPKKERREARLRAEVKEVELLTQIELAVRDTPNGRMRERRPLFIVGSRFERLHGSKWRLDGLELQANPLIWRNVRDPETGRLGTNYGLGAEGLPRLNPRTHPAALALGLILPIRFRLALNDGLDYHDLTGQNVLRYAGLRYSPRDPNRTWRALADDLDELVRLGGIRRWEWKGDREPSPTNVLRFYMAEGHRDRMALGVRPVELPAARPLTGEELRTWRAAAKLSQAKAAAALGVGIATVKRAESSPAEPLGPALREALQDALDRARGEIPAA